MKMLLRASVLALAAMTAVAPAQELDTRHYIYIEASSDVRARADTATVTVEISEKEKTAEEAIGSANGKTATLLASIRKIGVPLDDVETSHFAFDRVYVMAKDKDGKPIDYRIDPNRDTLDSYRATNRVTITIHDMRLIGAVVAAAVATGGNVTDPSFSASREDEYRMQAKSRAIQAALAKATLYATALGTRLGDILAIKEGSGYDADTMEYPISEGGDGEAADLAVLTDMDLPEVQSLPEPVPFIVPTRTFSASVAVKWEVPDESP
jgi:uncharacterized protein